MNPTTKANIYLLISTIIWGATFPIVRNAMNHIDPNLFVAARYALAVIVLLPCVITLFAKTSMKLLIISACMGLLNAVAYITQTIGLQTIPASRSAFITGISVVLVPFFAASVRLNQLRGLDIICTIICLLGIYILTGADLRQITIGDQWTLVCAIAFALQITSLQYISSQPQDAKLLTFYQLLFTIPLAALFSWHSNIKDLLHVNVIIAVLFCAIFATAITYYLQIKYQKFTTPTKVALIFSLEPVFASIFGLFVNHEAITINILVGGLFVLLSLTLPTFLVILRSSRA